MSTAAEPTLMATQARRPQTPSWDGVWIVIPAYNEARTIRALAEAALALCPRVMVIDDGSTDASAEQLHGLALTLLQHSFNQGKGSEPAHRVRSRVDARRDLRRDARWRRPARPG